MPKWPLTLAIVALPIAAGAGHKVHDVTATFVSADPKTNQFKVKLDDGSTSTGLAEGEAAKSLASLKAGDKIAVTCKDDEAGKHISATSIRALK